jgi:hypothetical protein
MSGIICRRTLPPDGRSGVRGTPDPMLGLTETKERAGSPKTLCQRNCVSSKFFLIRDHQFSFARMGCGASVEEPPTLGLASGVSVVQSGAASTAGDPETDNVEWVDPRGPATVRIHKADDGCMMSYTVLPGGEGPEPGTRKKFD